MIGPDLQPRSASFPSDEGVAVLNVECLKRAQAEVCFVNTLGFVNTRKGKLLVEKLAKFSMRMKPRRLADCDVLNPARQRCDALITGADQEVHLCEFAYRHRISIGAQIEWRD